MNNQTYLYHNEMDQIYTLIIIYVDLLETLFHINSMHIFLCTDDKLCVTNCQIAETYIKK